MSLGRLADEKGPVDIFREQSRRGHHERVAGTHDSSQHTSDKHPKKPWGDRGQEIACYQPVHHVHVNIPAGIKRDRTEAGEYPGNGTDSLENQPSSESHASIHFGSPCPADTHDIRIDAYGSVGDYLASGMDGLELHVHGSAQDQLGQILKAGKLVVHGDVGQTFMYGAKGGEVYILGNAAGRPLINAVGAPRVVINGTCLDFLAEAFMAGDPLNGGGFVILNGIALGPNGKIQELPTPYPGSNLFSMASGGAIYVRDPHAKLVNEQLNGSEFANVTQDDWDVILPYLKENERLFGIPIEDLLTVYGVRRPFEQVYRKVRAVRLAVLASMIEDSQD